VNDLIRAARDRHGEVTPCAGRTWAECVTEINGRRVLWYNSPDGSSHVIREGVDTDARTCYNQRQEAKNGDRYQ